MPHSKLLTKPGSFGVWLTYASILEKMKRVRHPNLMLKWLCFQEDLQMTGTGHEPNTMGYGTLGSQFWRWDRVRGALSVLCWGEEGRGDARL